VLTYAAMHRISATPSIQPVLDIAAGSATMPTPITELSMLNIDAPSDVERLDDSPSVADANKCTAALQQNAGGDWQGQHPHVAAWVGCLAFC
jgi:hypothetical protein